MRDFVGRAEALGAFNSPSEFCARQLPNARTKVHNAIAVMSCACLFIRVPHLGEDVVPEAVVLVFHGCVCRFVGRRLRRTEHTRASSDAYLPELGTAVELCC